MSRCPDEARLRLLLDEALPPEEQAELAAHLDGCADCPRRLERLVADPESWGAARNLAHGPPAEPMEPGLRRAVEELGGVATEDTPPGEPDADTLAFLTPPREAGHLGRLGQYEILEVVGRGGMGVVLKALDENLHRVVAIKALAPQLAVSATARRRFVREARAAAAVVHAHVVAIHDVNGDSPIPYLVMQHVAGMSLQQRLDQGSPLEVQEILRIGMQVARGLAAAHAQGLVHRDVKPANILLENGAQRVWITDFGLARAVDDASLTQSGVIAGTPLYMAPEQARGEPVDHRSDLFSLGSVLYTLCASHPPFQASGTLALLKRVGEDTPRPVREINPNVPGWLCDVIERLHAREPGARFQSAAEVAELFERHLAQEQQSQGAPADKPPPRSAPRGRWLLLPGLLALGGLCAYLPLGNQGPEPDPSPAAAVSRGTRPEPLPKAHGENGPSVPGNQQPAGKGLDREPPFVPWPVRSEEELTRLSSPLDELTRDQIAAPLLRLAGTGDAKRAPLELVAVLADVRLRMPNSGMTSWPAHDPDGEVLAVPCGEVVALFDARTGHPKGELGGHKGRVFAVALRPGGKQLAASVWGRDWSITLWDLPSGKPLRTLTGHRATVLRVAYSSDGKWLASCSDDRTAKLWDPDTGQLQLSFEGHTDHVGMVTFSPDGKTLATGSKDGTVRLWETATARAWSTLPGHTTSVSGLAFSPDGKYLASGSERECKLWDAVKLHEVRTLHRPAAWLAFTPDSRTLLTAGHDHLRGTAHEIHRHDPVTGKDRLPLRLGATGSLAVYDLSADGKTLFTMGAVPASPKLQAFHLGTGEEQFALGHTGPVFTVAVSPDGKLVASGGEDRAVRLWDLTSLPKGVGVRVRQLAPHSGKILRLAFRADGKWLAAGGHDGFIALHEIPDGREVRKLAGYLAPWGSGLAFTPDGRAVAAAGTDGLLHCWGVTSGGPGLEQPLDRKGPGAIRGIAFSPDGTRIAVGTQTGEVVVSAWPAGQTLRRFESPSAVTVVAFSPDGRALACGCNGPNPTLRVWDLVSGETRTFYGHKGDCTSVAFHPAGRLLATGATDGTVRLWSWDRRTGGGEVRVLERGSFGVAVHQVAFTPEGRYLATANANGTIYLLRVPRLGSW